MLQVVRRRWHLNTEVESGATLQTEQCVQHEIRNYTAEAASRVLTSDDLDGVLALSLTCLNDFAIYSSYFLHLSIGDDWISFSTKAFFFLNNNVNQSIISWYFQEQNLLINLSIDASTRKPGFVSKKVLIFESQSLRKYSFHIQVSFKTLQAE